MHKNTPSDSGYEDKTSESHNKENERDDCCLLLSLRNYEQHPEFEQPPVSDDEKPV